MTNFVSSVLQSGGCIKPLYIPFNEHTNDVDDTYCMTSMNPSVLHVNDKIYGIIRCVNYVFFHSEGKKIYHNHGTLVYLHPENDLHLRTENHLVELDSDLNIIASSKINMVFDKYYEPKWDFRGLEDARLMYWNDELYIAGVRRDYDDVGTGRMDLSKIQIQGNEVNEVSRTRLSPPMNTQSYCEKNWMPVLNSPFQFIKWTMPTEVVKVNTKAGMHDIPNTYRTHANTKVISDINADLRGSSQVNEWGDGYITCTHECNLFNNDIGTKDATYRHRFILFDKSFNITGYSDSFSFMDGHVEFCCGMSILGTEVLLTFSFQDNAAYILRFNSNLFNSIIKRI